MTRPRILLPLLTLLVVAWYVGISLRVNGMLVPPLDDSLIHFRYAEMAAAGHPFSFVDGEGFSSGATSLLWPFLLVPGVWLGFSGLNLYWWAILVSVVALQVGVVALWGLLEKHFDAWTAWAGSVAVLLCGPVLWGSSSGMEIGLFVGAALYALARPGFLAFAVLSTTRPEGMVLAWVLLGKMVVEAYFEPQSHSLRRLGGLFFCGSLGLLQPLINQLGTGSWMASSVLSKQAPSLTQASEVSTVGTIWDTFVGQAYLDIMLGTSGIPILFLAMVGVGFALRAEREQQRLGLAVAAGFLLPMGAVAVTVPLLVNMGRYLMPGLSLLLVLAAMGAYALDRTFLSDKPGWAGRLFTLGLPVLLLPTAGTWSFRLADGARDIQTQHVAAAEWIAAHTSPEDLIAVNDAGFVPYLARRKVLDLNGIVSQRALDWAQAGEGSVFSLIKRENPAYLVIFPGWFPGLERARALTPVWSAVLRKRTTSGGPELLIARPDMVSLNTGSKSSFDQPWDVIDFSDLLSERQHGFESDEDPVEAGRGNIVVSGMHPAGTMMIDGARVFRTSFRFTLRNGKEQPASLALRLCPMSSEVKARITVANQTRGWAFSRIEAGVWAERNIPVDQIAQQVMVDVQIDEAGSGVSGGLCLARMEWGPRQEPAATP